MLRWLRRSKVAGEVEDDHECGHGRCCASEAHTRHRRQSRVELRVPGYLNHERERGQAKQALNEKVDDATVGNVALEELDHRSSGVATATASQRGRSNMAAKRRAGRS